MSELALYEQMLEEEGYKCHREYRQAVERVLKDANIFFAELVHDIAFHIYTYQYGERKEQNAVYIGNAGKNLEITKEYLSEILERIG